MALRYSGFDFKVQALLNGNGGLEFGLRPGMAISELKSAPLLTYVT